MVNYISLDHFSLYQKYYIMWKGILSAMYKWWGERRCKTEEKVTVGHHYLKWWGSLKYQETEPISPGSWTSENTLSLEVSSILPGQRTATQELESVVWKSYTFESRHFPFSGGRGCQDVYSKFHRNFSSSCILKLFAKWPLIVELSESAWTSPTLTSINASYFFVLSPYIFFYFKN